MGWLLGALLGVPGSQIALSGAITHLAGTRDALGLRALQAAHQAAHVCVCCLGGREPPGPAGCGTW